MDEDVSDDVAQRLIVLGPVVENRPPVEADTVRQFAGFHCETLRDASALKEAEQVERRFQRHVLEYVVVWEILDLDHGKLLRNAVSWASRELAPVTVAGVGVLDVTYWQQKNSLTVHLVNLTNPMMMKGPIRELIPVGEQKVRARLPQGLRAKKVRLLVAGLTPAFQQTADWIDVVVPSVAAHEVVAIDV